MRAEAARPDGVRVRVLFVDDEAVACRAMKRQFARAGYECAAFTDAREGLAWFGEHGADLVVTDLRMPGMDGYELIATLREVDPEVPIVVITAYPSVEGAVEAMKRGASDFIKKPFDFEELQHVIERTLGALKLKRENDQLRRRLDRCSRERFGMVGESAAMRRLYETIAKLAQVPCNVVITGESGVGKELVARALHDYGPRAEAPFVVIDCGALTETLLESELFGHEKGAFTGALHRKRGLMEEASGGTLFLDEISNISDAMQVKLMRAIEQQCITRVGGTTPIPIDLRIIAASNRDLEAMVREGSFRHDFYHRLSVVTLRVPSLAERREDIPALVEHFVREFARRYGRRIQGFDPVSMRRLCEADWPGNVRQLRNVVERCVILSDGPILRWPPEGEDMPEGEVARMRFPEDDLPPLEEVENAYIRHVLERTGGRKTAAARILGIDKTTLWRKLRRLEAEQAPPGNIRRREGGGGTRG